MPLFLGKYGGLHTASVYAACSSLERCSRISMQSGLAASAKPFDAKFRSAERDAASSISAQSILSLGSRASSSRDISPAPEHSSTALPGFGFTKSASRTESVVIGKAPAPS